MSPRKRSDDAAGSDRAAWRTLIVPHRTGQGRPGAAAREVDQEGELYNPFKQPPSQATHPGLTATELNRLRFELNMAALAAAALEPGSALTQAAPMLASAGLSCRPARLADVASGWFAYWARELNLAVSPDRATWRRAVALQALYESGLLRPGAAIRLDDAMDRDLGAYLGDLFPLATRAPETAADFWLTAGWASPPPPTTYSNPARCVWLGDFAFLGGAEPGALSQPELEAFAEMLGSAGWAVGDLSFDPGDHPLDAYVALPTDEPEAIGPAGQPRLRVATPTALTVPYLLIADRTG